MAKFVILKSCDHKTFEVPRETACLSFVLRHMLNTLPESQDAIPLYRIDANTLRLVLKWAHIHMEEKRSRTLPTAPDYGPAYEKFFNSYNKSTLCNILMAANYLDIPQLREMANHKLAVLLKGRGPAQIRNNFILPDDISDVQKRQLQEEGDFMKINHLH